MSVCVRVCVRDVRTLDPAKHPCVHEIRMSTSDSCCRPVCDCETNYVSGRRLGCSAGVWIMARGDCHNSVSSLHVRMAYQ